jgi:hypothetical protein
MQKNETDQKKVPFAVKICHICTFFEFAINLSFMCGAELEITAVMWIKAR